MIEALVALAVIAAMLAAIGSAIATTIRHARAIDERLALAGTAQALLAALPSREALRAGRTIGRLNGFDWRIDVAPMPLPAEAGWHPLAVDLRVQRSGGGSLDLRTIRLASP